MLARSKPVRKIRKAARPGRLKGKELLTLRVECWLRDKGKCQCCGKATIFDAPIEWDNSYHMHHVRNKRMWGDNLGNVIALCGKCHRDTHSPKVIPPKSGGKPVPRKEAA